MISISTSWLFGCLVLLHINPFQVIQRRIKFHTIQFSISIVFLYKQLTVKKVHLNVKIVQLNVKTVLFQAIQFSINTELSFFLNSSISNSSF